MSNFSSFSSKLGEKASELYETIFKYINKLKWFIVIFWIVISLAMVYCVFGFLHNTSMVVTAPKGSLSDEANKIYKEEFSSISGISQVALVIKQFEYHDEITDSDYLRDFSKYFNQTVYEDEKGYLVRSLVGRYIIPKYQTRFEKLISGFKAVNMVSGNATLIQIELKPDEPTANSPFIKRMRKYIDDYVQKNGKNGYEFAVTGYDALSVDLQKAVIDALQRMEFIVFPIAILILFYVIQSPVLLVIPIVNVVCIALLSFGAMYPVSLNRDVFGIAPAMMLSIIAATAIDYSLFLLTRYTEEINKKQSYYNAVSNMLRTSGRTIATSGFVMLFCFCVVAIFPFDVIRYIGLGCAISVAITLVVDLTMTPALMLCFPKFFSYQSCCPCSRRCVRYTQRRARFENWGDRMWHKFATVQSKPWVSTAMLILGVAVLIPFCVFIYRFQWTLDNNQVVPIGTEFYDGYEYLEDSFSLGVLYPFHILITEDKKKVNITSQEYYDFTVDFYNVMTTQMTHAYTEDSLICFNAAGGRIMEPSDVEYALQQEGYTNALLNYISDDQTIVNCQLIPNIDPTLNSTQLVAELRDHFKPLEEKYGYRLLLQGTIVDGVDCVNTCMGYFIYVIIALFVVILVMVLLFFKSGLVPLRVVFTTLLTLLFCYGATSLVYCTDYFDSIEAVKETNNIYWAVPIITVPVIVGLSLDYDIFLFSRIREYRARGYSTKVATIYGVERTGYLITFCGLIMAVAFCGLFFASIYVLNLFAFLLVLAVLCDTFIVRTLIVPSFIHLFGEANWWPIKHETTVDVYEEADEYHNYDHLDSDDEDEEEKEQKEDEEKKNETVTDAEKEEQFNGNDKTPLLN